MLRAAVRVRHLLATRAIYPSIRYQPRCSRPLLPLSVGRSMHSWSSEIVHHGNEKKSTYLNASKAFLNLFDQASFLNEHIPVVN